MLAYLDVLRIIRFEIPASEIEHEFVFSFIERFLKRQSN